MRPSPRATPSRRRVPAVRVEGRTLVHQSGLRLRLKWAEARCLAEAIHVALSQLRPVQVTAYGWVVRSTVGMVELDGRRFDFPLVGMSRSVAVSVSIELARSGRMEVARE